MTAIDRKFSAQETLNMKAFLTAAAILLSSSNLMAEDIFRIEIGKDYNRYSEADLRRRVWELERAVWQLQQRVFQLEVAKPETADSWICTISTMGNTYTGTGASKAVAIAATIKNCKDDRGDGFFCKDPKCEK